MNDLVTKFSGWLLMTMLAMLVLEILCVGVFAASWCLHTLFGHYAFAVLGLVALIAALVHHHHERARTKDQLTGSL